jgi:hypothetical protein
MFWPTRNALLRRELDFMNNPNELRQPLAELLQTIETGETSRAVTDVRMLAEGLAETLAPPDPLQREYRTSVVRCSGLRHAILREIRLAEKHLAGGNCAAAANALRAAIELLPEPQQTWPPQRPSKAN